MAILVTLVLALVPGQRVKLVAGWVGGAGWGWEGWHATGLAGWRGWRPSPTGTTSCPASQVPHSATAPIIFPFFSFDKISLESFEKNARKLVRTGHFRQNVCEEAWGWIREIDKLSFWGNRGDTNEVKASLRCFRLFLRSPSATTNVWVSSRASSDTSARPPRGLAHSHKRWYNSNLNQHTASWVVHGSLVNCLLKTKV